MQPQPLGRSDRRIAATDAAKTIERVTRTASRGEPMDPATQSVLLAVVRQQAIAAALAKDRQSTSDLLQRMAAVAPNDLFVRALKQRVEYADSTSIDVSGLIH